MIFLIVVFIVLGWAGWVWAWGRDRYQATGVNSLTMGTGGFGTPAPTALSAPRTARAARRRRRQVLASLVGALVISLLISLSWTPWWFVTILLAATLAVYARAVLQLERPVTGAEQLPPLRARLAPVVDGENRVVRQPGPVGRPQ